MTRRSLTPALVAAEDSPTHLRAVLTLVALAVCSAELGCSKKETPSPQKPAQKTAPATAARPALPALPVPPTSLGNINVPKDNPLTAEKVALGHQLFFDKRLSTDGSRACYSCHLNEDGTGGHDPTAMGPGDKPLPRLYRLSYPWR